SGVGANIEFARLPFMPGVVELVRQGFVTGASGRNWSGYGTDVRLSAQHGDVERNLLADPQTSGGLLVACDPAAADQVLAIFAAEGFSEAMVIGEVIAGEARIAVA
ncbi:MAG: AIR synthase-related protein, partial [Betaproteobacteria bacterium]